MALLIDRKNSNGKSLSVSHFDQFVVYIGISFLTNNVVVENFLENESDVLDEAWFKAESSLIHNGYDANWSWRSATAGPHVELVKKPDAHDDTAAKDVETLASQYIPRQTVLIDIDQVKAAMYVDEAFEQPSTVADQSSSKPANVLAEMGYVDGGDGVVILRG